MAPSSPSPSPTPASGPRGAAPARHDPHHRGHRRGPQAMARWLTGLFHRSLEVEGAERVPAEGPLVVVANHTNGLIDPVLLLAALPRPVRFLGKSTLWEIAALRPFLAWAGVIPVYRRHDPGVDPRKNQETFAASRRVLAEGGAIALFPEGVSHNEPSLMPLKTGAARIALETAREPAGERGDHAPVHILPVGLAFDRRERFRSRALVWIGEAFPVEAPRGEDGGPQPGDPGGALRQAVRELTGRIDEGLRRVTVNHETWREARLFERAAELFGRPEVELPGRRSLAESRRLGAALVRAYRELRRRIPGEVDAVVHAAARYDRALALFGLRDDQVAARYPLAPVLRFAFSSLAVLALGLPVALVGAALNLLPYQAVARVAGWGERTADQRATWKLFGALFLYPACWLLQALALGIAVGTAVDPATGLGTGLAAFAAAPITGRLALEILERARRLQREGRAFLLLRTRPRFAHRIRALRRGVLDPMETLAARWQAEGPAPPASPGP